MDRGTEHRDEDVGNIIALEHVNVSIPDQIVATLFYVVGLGLTRDPHMTVGVDNMWVNVGEQQFHLPTRSPQVLRGHVGLVLPDLQALRRRLEAIQSKLGDTRFDWRTSDDHVEVISPWGNRLRCFEPQPRFGQMTLGIPYVELLVTAGSAEGIARFYTEIIGAPASVEANHAGASARVQVGRSQRLVFRETEGEIPPYDGHHVAVYIANFSRPYSLLKSRGLITDEVRNHQFRFQTIVDPDGGEELFRLEHEVRSLHHPMYGRALVNRHAD